MQTSAPMVSPSPKILSDFGEKPCRVVLINCHITQRNDDGVETYYVNPAPNPKTVHPVVSFTDEQVIALLKAVVGRDKPIDQKQLWAGAYWFFRWYGNFPVTPKKFCDRINRLCGAETFEFPCCYDNMRKLAFLGFMNSDARLMDEVKYSNNDLIEFCCCREVVLALTEEMVKMGL